MIAEPKPQDPYYKSLFRQGPAYWRYLLNKSEIDTSKRIVEWTVTEKVDLVYMRAWLKNQDLTSLDTMR